MKQHPAAAGSTGSETLDPQILWRGRGCRIPHRAFGVGPGDAVIRIPGVGGTSTGGPARHARRMLALFRDNGLLTTLVEAAGRKSAVYAFRELLNIAEGREAF